MVSIGRAIINPIVQIWKRKERAKAEKEKEKVPALLSLQHPICNKVQNTAGGAWGGVSSESTYLAKSVPGASWGRESKVVVSQVSFQVGLNQFSPSRGAITKYYLLSIYSRYLSC